MGTESRLLRVEEEMKETPCRQPFMRLDCVGKERAGYGEGTLLKKNWVINRCSFIAIGFLMGNKLKVFLFCREEASAEKEKANDDKTRHKGWCCTD